VTVRWKFLVTFTDESGDAKYTGVIDLSPPMPVGETRSVELENEGMLVYAEFERIGTSSLPDDEPFTEVK
jgi:hypothetical protein